MNYTAIGRQISFFKCKICASQGVSKSWNFFRGIQNGVKHFNAITKSNHILEDKPLSLKLLISDYDNINFGSITKREGQVLLQCCGVMTTSSSLEERQQMCQNIYTSLAKYNKLDNDIYQTYIQICTENGILINSATFLESLKCEPDSHIYKGLLENACECGDLSQAFVLLETMKNFNVAVDENIFNNLVLVHTLKGGLEASEKVLATMKAAQLKETVQTHLAIFKGVIRSKNHEEFTTFLRKYSLSLNEDQFLNILRELGLTQNIHWLDDMKNLFSELNLTREFMNKLKDICVYLIYMKKSDTAVKLFTYFQSEPEENFGFFILEEMLHSKSDPNEIISTAKNFLENSSNTYFFEKLTGVALENQYFELVWKLFENLSTLRPHFFWPLLVNAKNMEGETGIFKIIQKVNEMGIRLDSDSLEYYVLPFCNQGDMKNLLEKLKKEGFTIRELLSPLLLLLLREGRVQEASELAKFYQVAIQGEKLFNRIRHAWSLTKDPSVVPILQKHCESVNVQNDLVGDFLINCLKTCKSKTDFEQYLRLLKAIHKKNLRLTVTSAEFLRDVLSNREVEQKTSESILNEIDQILEFKSKAELKYIPHPKDMTSDELECHLIELSEKNMETRGILRKLIQMHANQKNVERVQQLRKQFIEAGYEESIGMKASLMYTYTKAGNIEAAMDMYKEIKNVDPKFIIDEYKIIDLATALVKTDRLAESRVLLDEASKLRKCDDASVQRNCVELLNAFQNEDEQSSMFHYLVDKGFCKVNNIMLGPLVRIHLSRGDLDKAAKTYINLAEQFKCTPLQFELIRNIAHSKNEELLQRILDSSSNIHGPLSTQVNLICALAEIGEEKILIKILATTKFQIKHEINKKCARWIKEGKSDALITLVKSCTRLPSDIIDMDVLLESVIKTYALKNDCEAAVKFYEHLLENEVPVNRNLENQLYTLSKVNNYSLPQSIRINSKGRN